MASRAFFRCRACGEPVAAGAYRCPVCGIDFPAGTSGAPKAPKSPADVSFKPSRDKSHPLPVPEERDIVDAMDAALAADDDEAVFEEAPKDTPEPAAPATATATARAPVAEPAESAPAEPSAALDKAPERSGPKPRGDTLLLRPAHETGGEQKSGNGLGVRPTRVERANVPVVQPTPAKKPKRKRSLIGALFGTIFTAIILIGAIAGGGYALQKSGILASKQTEPEPTFQSIVADDGWVDLPPSDQDRVVRADGAFRLRVDGKVYTLRGDDAVRVPAAAKGAVRVIRGATTATVEPAPPS